MTFLLILWLLQSNPVAFENEYVRVMRDSAPCASATAPGCGYWVMGNGEWGKRYYSSPLPTPDSHSLFLEFL